MPMQQSCIVKKLWVTITQRFVVSQHAIQKSRLAHLCESSNSSRKETHMQNNSSVLSSENQKRLSQMERQMIFQTAASQFKSLAKSDWDLTPEQVRQLDDLLSAIRSVMPQMAER